MIHLNNASFDFAGDILFEDVSYRINYGDRIGLVGKNGAGKSTMLKILSRELFLKKGQLSHEGEISVGFLRQDIDFKKDRTVWQEAESAFEKIKTIERSLQEINETLSDRTDYESEAYQKIIEKFSELTEQYQLLGGYTIAENIEKILLGLGFSSEDFSRSTEEFSGGWRMRIELAKLLLQKHEVLLLDEPTNHLDIDSILWLEDFLKNYPGAIVLVSHDKQFLDQVTNRTIEIIHGGIEDYKCFYSKYLKLRQERHEKLLQSQKNQEKHIKHTEELIEKFRYKPSKAAFAQSLIKRLEKMDRIEAQDIHHKAMNIRFNPSLNPGKLVIEMKKVSKSFGAKTIFSDVNFIVERGEKIAFVGQNGQGKSTLAKIIVRELPHLGKVQLGHNVKLGYFAQNQSDTLEANKTVLEEAEESATEETRKRTRDFLGAFLFSGDQVQKKVKMLSGGERNRLALCKLLLQPFNVLIMDEPTNHLDMLSKEVLKNALVNYEGTLIVVSHDRDFLQGLISKVYEFREGKVNEFLGGIQEYLRMRKAENFRQIEKVTPVSTKLKEQGLNQEGCPQKELKKLKNKINKVEVEIEALEKSIAESEKSFLCAPPKPDQMIAYEQLREQLDKKLILWEALQKEGADFF